MSPWNNSVKILNIKNCVMVATPPPLGLEIADSGTERDRLKIYLPIRRPMVPAFGESHTPIVYSIF
jgi:hypothetical protein